MVKRQRGKEMKNNRRRGRTNKNREVQRRRGRKEKWKKER